MSSNSTPQLPEGVPHSRRDSELESRRVSCGRSPARAALPYPATHSPHISISRRPNIPARHYAGLCRFDYQNERERALAYRKAEVPFLVHNVPGIDEVVQRWSDPEYLSGKLGNKRYLTEYSENNHFMYFNEGRHSPQGWKPPVENRHMAFTEWLDYALAHDNSTVEAPHMYFRFSSLETGSWLKEDLQILTPKANSLFIVDPSNARGIHCRFGMRGINAAAHFDGSRNFIAIFGGYRRYMMAGPRNCNSTYLLPSAHPSGRHSDVDWSNPDLSAYPNFPQTTVNEQILVRVHVCAHVLTKTHACAPS